MEHFAELTGLLLLALTLPGSLYLALLTVAAAMPVRASPHSPDSGPLAIVVPAHDEEAHIARTVKNLLALAERDGATDVVVVADNCSDQTAAIARAAGARVLERSNPEQRGKGYALDHAFSLLLKEDYAFFAVVDADTVADDNFIATLRLQFGAGAQALQTRYTVLNTNDSARTQLAEIALAAFNVLRPHGRDRLGLSAGILGNGFALRRDTLEQVPYSAASVVEDLEYHLKLIAAGVRVTFADATTVRGEMPSGGQGSTTQRARWEGGRLRMLLDHAPQLTKQILRGHWRLLEPLADLLLLPLAYHLLAILLSITFLAWSSPAIALITAAISLSIVALHVLTAMRIGQIPWKQLRVLAAVPRYLLWKIAMIFPTLSAARRDSRWVRTNRKGA